jgi:transcriptional regulator with XRE-family HTH domain
MLEKLFGQRIRELRQGNDLTQELLAEAIGVDSRTIRRWESGETGPEFNKLEKIAETLGVPVEGLFVFQRTDDDA